MAPPDRALTLLLPPREALAASLPEPFARVLVRGDRGGAGPGWQAQLLRHFQVTPRGLPVAALTRQLDAADAADGIGAWMRADPAFVRADMATGRLLACGELGLDIDECQALIRPLKPLFGDAGFPISAPHPARWYLMLPQGSRLPDFTDPHTALGGDLARHLPDGPDAGIWRRLLNEAQVVLHNHPQNEARRAAGKLPVNSLWFWGGGAWPHAVSAAAARIGSDDALLRGLAQAADADLGSADEALAGLEREPVATLVDLRDRTEAERIERNWLRPALDALAAGRIDRLRLDFGDGQQVDYRHRHRWRLWRRS